MGSLFKYRACGVNTDKIFTTGCLHYSNRSAFNDPYDCLLLIDKSKIFYRHGVGLFPNGETREVLLELSTDDIERKYQSVADRIEIFCLSADGKQMQMWSHYAKNHTGICLESDLIIRLHDGRWAAVEVKTGSKEIEDAAKNLTELAKQVDTSKIGQPAFLMVLTGGQYAYRREDGVYIVPIGCLKP